MLAPRRVRFLKIENGTSGLRVLSSITTKAAIRASARSNGLNRLARGPCGAGAGAAVAASTPGGATVDGGAVDVGADVARLLDAPPADVADAPAATDEPAVDLGTDAPAADVQPEAAVDAGVDSGAPDVGFDAGTDTGAVDVPPPDVPTDSGVDPRCDAAVPTFCVLGTDRDGNRRDNFCTDLLTDRYNCGGCALTACIGMTYCLRGVCVRR